jgi:integrase/recombinase XerC
MTADCFTRNDFAALRAWLQGVPVDVIAGRYFVNEDDEIPDARVAHRKILAVRDALMIRAQQHNCADLATLLEKPPRHSDSGMSRATRALGELEALGVPRPSPSHPVHLWFAPILARRLRAGNVHTVAELIKLSTDRGSGWWRGIPRVGVIAAGTLERWIEAHCHALKEDDRPVAVLNLDIRAVPTFEKMQLPAQLNGNLGSNRGERGYCAIDALDDHQAVHSWLSLWPASSETYRAYRREAERFLAWCIVERGKAFSSATTDDCVAYRDWLSNPEPSHRWIGPRVARNRPGWRPFVGPLSKRSRDHAETIVSALCSWLVGRGYLRGNPWDGVPRAPATRTRMQIEKAVPLEQWQTFSAWLNVRSTSDAATRTAFAAIQLLRDSGMRCQEAAQAQRENLRSLNTTSALWGELEITGKGGFDRVVPISRACHAALAAHWKDRGEEVSSGPLLAPLCRPNTPRSLAKTSADGYSVRGLRQIIARAYDTWLAELMDENPDAARSAKRVRPHALRHTFGIHAVEGNTPLDVIQAVLGHASSSTTAIYTRSGERRRRTEMARFYEQE